MMNGKPMVERLDYIERTLIPQILKLIEESGLSYHDAAMVPDLLKVGIQECTTAANKRGCFTVLDEKGTQ